MWEHSDGGMRFRKQSSVLHLHPRQYPRAAEDSLTTHEVRQCLFKTRRGRTYRALYTIVEDEVRVLRVRGPGQAPLTDDELAHE